MCVCSLKYIACKAHAPYCHLWPAPRYSIFPHYLINDKIFEIKKMLLNIKGAFLSSLQVLCATFLILRRNDMIKTVYRSSRKIVYSCYILMKLEFSRHISEGTHIQNFRKFCPVEAKFFHADRRTDRHDVADSRFFETLRTRLKKIRNSTHDYFICCRNTLFSSAMC